ncbi:antitermination regulator [Flavonifractor sp. An82]|uniref:ANTAR domain-containing response regulator n=1 Tax=Flavonifractor sp. An82 TaxID=1965660 RepID=UPI000B36980B|nr:ANTAR domain-containing protein [Flavonifractor sp. An82]OUN20552.1 antitermination regulator [Flavonifractor sp. An82]
MEQVIVAFENTKNAGRIKDILETSGTASCILCKTADQVRRTVNKLHITALICSFKLADQSAEALAGDLPPSCAVLVLASQNLLDLLQDDDLFRLPAPVSKGDLTASVRMLLQMGRRLERALRPRRSPEEQALIQQAKALLMDRNGMTEEQAHRFLQKTSMDNGTKLLQTAQMVLDSAE